MNRLWRNPKEWQRTASQKREKINYFVRYYIHLIKLVKSYYLYKYTSRTVLHAYIPSQISIYNLNCLESKPESIIEFIYWLRFRFMLVFRFELVFRLLINKSLALLFQRTLIDIFCHVLYNNTQSGRCRGGNGFFAEHCAGSVANWATAGLGKRSSG